MGEYTTTTDDTFYEYSNIEYELVAEERQWVAAATASVVARRPAVLPACVIPNVLAKFLKTYPRLSLQPLFYHDPVGRRLLAIDNVRIWGKSFPDTDVRTVLGFLADIILLLEQCPSMKYSSVFVGENVVEDLWVQEPTGTFMLIYQEKRR